MYCSWGNLWFTREVSHLKAYCHYYGDLEFFYSLEVNICVYQTPGRPVVMRPMDQLITSYSTGIKSQMFLEITRFIWSHLILLPPKTFWDLSPVEYVVVNRSMDLEITRPWWSTWKPLCTEMPHHISYGKSFKKFAGGVGWWWWVACLIIVSLQVLSFVNWTLNFEFLSSDLNLDHGLDTGPWPGPGTGPGAWQQLFEII